MKKHFIFAACSLVLAITVSVSAHAASYVHQIEGLLEIDQRSFDPDGTAGEYDYDVFRINAIYRHQYQSRMFLVGGIDFSAGNLDGIIFNVGGEYNAMANANDNLEAGGGVLLNLYTGDYSGFGFRPYGFLRAFITRNLFISGQLSFDWAFVDMNGTDGDLTGIMIRGGLGYAF